MLKYLNKIRLKEKFLIFIIELEGRVCQLNLNL